MRATVELKRMSAEPRRCSKIATKQGWISIALLTVAALCLGYSISAGDYRQLSELVFQALSFPLGWAFAWVATDLTVVRSPQGVYPEKLSWG